MARARSYAERAIELAPDLADSHTALGIVQYFGDWDWEAAEQSYRRALDLDPGYFLAHEQYAVLLAHQRRFGEALRHLERARDLNPLAFDARGVNPGLIHGILGDGERAAAYWQDAIEIAPTYYLPQLSLGQYHCRNGRPDQAVPHLERAIELNPDEPWLVANLAYCHAVSDRDADARALLAELETLSAEEYVSPMARALMHVGLGEIDLAFEQLERAYELGAPRLLDLGIEPPYEPLRSDLRYADLMDRLKLPTVARPRD